MSSLVRWPVPQPPTDHGPASQLVGPLAEPAPTLYTRSFNSTSDNVTCSIGSLADLRDGNLTLAVIVKLTDTTDAGIIEFHTGAGIRCGLVHGGTTPPLGLQDNLGGQFVGPPPALVANVWCVGVITRTAGVLRSHVYNFNTATWTHTDGPTVGAVEDTLTSVKIGGTPTGTPGFGHFGGLIAVGGARVGTALSDVQVESLAIGLQEWVDVFTGNAAVWRLDQDSTATAVPDIVGGADQTAISGTTVVADSPPGFDWELAGGVARDMAGNAPAAADLDGSLVADRPLAAAASAAADLDGSAAADRPVAAMATAAADLDGTATFARGLAASSSAAADASGALDVDTGLTEVAGNAPAAADLDGSLTVAYTLAATAPAAADLDGSLTTERPLGASGSAAADLDGSASAARPLSATAAAAGAATGTASTARPLTATSISAASGATGTLDTSSETLLDGKASAAADLDGSLTVAYTLAATANAASGATGSLAVAKMLAATAGAAADAAGSLVRARPLAATAPTATSADGLLARLRPYAATAAAAAGITADLFTSRVPPPRWVEGDATATGLVEGDTAGSGQVEGVLVGAGIVEGSASV
jgi:hypothetical protein